MADVRCSMVVDWTVDKHGEPDEEIVCGLEATRTLGQKAAQTPGASTDTGWVDGCCDECFEAMRRGGDYTDEELETMYPRRAREVA